MSYCDVCGEKKFDFWDNTAAFSLIAGLVIFGVVQGDIFANLILEVYHFPLMGLSIIAFVWYLLIVAMSWLEQPKEAA